ncbi:MAG: TetR/AcrR family transcriptional regulator [Deltaproteobacteria bacterium]|nr:TetR/AcrR family transcriptional regulator [Deltaproteobacteria bacterium]
MGRPKSVTDDRLLQHARDVFLESGASGSTKEIARRARISEATLFQRYPTKAALFLAALVPPKVDVDEIVFAPTAEAHPQEALTEIGRRMLAYFRTLIPTVMHLMTHPSIRMSDLAAHFEEPPEQALVDALAAYLRQAQAKGLLQAKQPLAAAGLVVSAVHSLALFELMEIHGGQDMEHAVALFVEALWTGLSPQTDVGAVRKVSKQARKTS